MKMKTVKVKVYQYSELNEEAKERATELHELYRAVYLPIEERTFNQKSL